MQQVVNKVEPGLVVVDTTLQYSSEAGAGTGMVINPSGLVLTNNHVIAGSTKITATVVATGRTYPATVVGYDKTGDIALIRLQGAAGLNTVPVGNSAEVRTGETVVALGNAEGQGTIIPAGGQVTGLDETITATDQGGTASTETLHGMIQTNADVPGDSGGRWPPRQAGDRHGHRRQRCQPRPAAADRVRDPDQHRPSGRAADRRGPRQFRDHDRVPAVPRDFHQLRK